MTTDASGWADLNTYSTASLLAHLDWLRKERTYKEAANLIIEARAYALRIAAAERMLAIHNRRATEAEDQRQAEERAAQPALTADEVRAVVREVALPVLDDKTPWRMEFLEPVAEAIAAKVAEKLAGRAVGLSETERILLRHLRDDVHAAETKAHRSTEHADAELAAAQGALLDRLIATEPCPAPDPALQEWAIDVVFDGPPGPTAGRFVEVEDLSGKSVGVGQWIDRGNGMWALRIPRAHPAQRETDLREAFVAGGQYIADNGVVSVVDLPKEAAEYARSKAGA